MKETNMSELKDREIRSRAEVLYCLDVLIRHLCDEGMMDTWLAVGLSDGTLGKWPTDEEVEPFFCYAEDIGEFEDKVISALSIIRHEAMKVRTEYVKGASA